MTFAYGGPDNGRIFNPLIQHWGDAQHGMFLVDGPHARKLLIQASNGEGWEHVSVSVTGSKGAKAKVPTWPEMCFVKDMFWDVTDLVIQFHPRIDDYVNHHPGCLHLWAPIGREMPTPPPELVGPTLSKELTDAISKKR